MPEISSISGSSQSYRISSSGENRADSSVKGSLSAKKELSSEEKKQIAELKARDNEVRAHEAAHVAAGGQYIRSGASYQYQTGPDGGRYAVGGEVSIDTSAVKGDPEATIAKMQVVKRAAAAPASPSGQDRAVASAAAATEMNAREELAAETTSSSTSDTENKNAFRISNQYTDKGGVKSIDQQLSSIDLTA